MKGPVHHKSLQQTVTTSRFESPTVFILFIEGQNEGGWTGPIVHICTDHIYAGAYNHMELWFQISIHFNVRSFTWCDTRACRQCVTRGQHSKTSTMVTTLRCSTRTVSADNSKLFKVNIVNIPSNFSFTFSCYLVIHSVVVSNQPEQNTWRLITWLTSYAMWCNTSSDKEPTVGVCLHFAGEASRHTR